MMTALTSMAYVATNAFSDIALARQRQTANALLDEAIERLRALPYDTVSLGMRTSDLAGDPRVLGAGTLASPYRLASSNERIVHVATNQLVEPLVPNVTPKTVDNIVYATRIYLTHFQDNPASGAVTVTAYTDWFSGVRHHGDTFMRTSTVIFSPAAAAVGSGSAACLTTATHPFSGPCVPFLTGSAVVKAGQTRVISGGTTHLVDAPAATSLMQLEQTASVQGWATSNGATLNSTGTPSAWGYAAGSSQAHNDPAATGGPVVHHRTDGTAAAPGASMSATLGASTTSLNISGGGSFESVSATAANATNVCRDTAGTEVSDTPPQPCGRSVGTGSGATTLSVGLDFLGLGLGTMDVVQQDSVTVMAHTNRDLTPSGVCLGTSSAGCIHARATRSIAAYRVGGVPNALKPAGFSYLLELSGYSDSVTAEAGIGAGPPGSTVAGTVRYWNGLGYTSVAIAAGVNLPIPPLVVSSGTVTITINVDVRTGAPSTSSTSTTCLATLACRTRSDAVRTAPFRGTVTYDVRVLGVSQLTFSTVIDLGDLAVSAAYADPPSA